MKKLCLTIVIFAAVCSLAACGGEAKPADGSVSDSSSAQISENPSATQNPAETDSTDSEPAKTDKTDDKPSDVALGDIEAAIANALGDGYLCTVDVPEDELTISCIGWLDMDKIEEYIVKIPAVFGQDTVGIVKCKPGYADEAVKRFNGCFGQSVDYVRQYPFDVAKVEGTRVYKVDDIVMYIVAGAAYEGEDKEEEAKLADSEYEKIDGALKELFGSNLENLASIPLEEVNGGIMPR